MGIKYDCATLLGIKRINIFLSQCYVHYQSRAAATRVSLLI